MNNKSIIEKFEKILCDKKEKAILYKDETLIVLNVGHESVNATFYFWFDEPNNNVQILARDFIKIPNNKIHMCEKLVNKYNRKYRWIKLEWDEKDNKVYAEYDMNLYGDNVEEQIFDMMGALFDIIIDVSAEMLDDIRDDKRMNLCNTLDEALRYATANAE